MKKYVLEGHVDQDGNLALNVPTGLPESNVRVEMSIEPVEFKVHPDWPEGFRERFAGILDDETFVRPAQIELEERKPFE